jgi:hypothetical protein
MADDIIKHLKQHRTYGEVIDDVFAIEYPIDSSTYRRQPAKKNDVSHESSIDEANEFFKLIPKNDAEQ